MFGSLSEDWATRFGAMGSSDVLDPAPESVFDAVARCAAEVAGFPCAAVVFFDGPRRWCKARMGGLPSEWVGNEPPGYYVGQSAAVRAPDGVAVGAVAVLDRRPRRLRAPQARVLTELARLVEALLEGRPSPPSHDDGHWWKLVPVDTDGRLLDATEAIEVRSGRSVASRHGRSMLVMVDPSGRPAGEARIAAEARVLELVARGAALPVIFDAVRARAEASLTHRATHDDVTGLANRALLEDRLAAPSPCETGLTAIVLCEVGGLQPVRASFGHDVGDELLIAVADRLQACVGIGDTACRLGSQEFAVLLDPCPHVDDAVEVARRFLASMDAPFSVYGRDVRLDLRIGIAAGRTDERRRGRLLSEADAAMRQVDHPAGGFKLFEPQMLDGMLDRVELEAGLRRAIKHGQLALHYQPKIDIGSGRIIGFEALARWHHPQRGPIEPAVFIPLAEDTGLIGALGLWAHAQASTQLATWTAATPNAATLHVAVNVSTRQLHAPRFADTMAALATDAGVDPGRIVLEITEGILAHDDAEPIAVVRQLHELGFQISIDDFGTGYSSLARLTTFPVDELKIDRAFIRRIDGSERSSAIASAIIVMGHNLGCHVTAEGVETRAQLEFLRAHHCDTAQGYLLGRPSPPEDVSPA